MKNKKHIISIAFGTVFIVSLLLFFAMQSKLDCSTVESRELRLSKLSGMNNYAHISYETKIDDYIVCGYISSNNRQGLAIFKPIGEGKYRFYCSCFTENDKIVYENVIINQKCYILFWANKANLDYAEISYTPSNKSKVIVKLDATDNKIVYIEPQAKEYELEYVFVDTNGNRYK